MNRFLLMAVQVAALGLSACNKPADINVLPPPAAAPPTPEASQATDNTRVGALPSAASAASN